MASAQPAAPDGPVLTLLVSARETAGQPPRPLPAAFIVLLGDKCQQRTSTDDLGAARIASCPPGIVTASVEARGYARDRRAIALSNFGTVERIELAPAAALSGRVVDEAGLGLNAVTLVARLLEDGQEPAPPWSTITSADGSFAFETLPLGRVTLDVRDGGEHEPLTLAEIALPNDDLAITLRRTAAVGGHVIDAEGEPAATATVTLAGSGVWPARVIKADEHGAFEFSGLPEGVYELRAELATQVSDPLEGVRLQPGMRQDLDLVLAPGVVLLGSVRAAVTGKPLPGAVLEIAEEALSGQSQRARADALGGFQLPGLRPTPYRVTVRQPGYVTQQRWLKPGGASTVIELLRAAAISGKVEDADGQPITRADIEVSGRSITGAPVHMVGPVQEALAYDAAQGLQSPGDNLGVTSGHVPRIPLQTPDALLGALGATGFQSDDAGNFRLEGLPPGQLVVTARKPRVGAGRSATLTLKPGATLDDVTITLPRGYPLRGRVVDAHGAAVAHVRVDLQSAGDPARSLTTDADGGFEFAAARGECVVWARPLGAPAAKVTGNAYELSRRELTIALEGGTDRLFGRVLDARGQPLDAASLRLEVERSHGYAPVLLSEADGTFEFTALPPPPYTLTIEHPEQLPVRGLRVTNTREALVVRMEAGTQLTGVVLNEQTNAPVVAAEVAFKNGGFATVLRTHADGSFEFRHVPTGAFELAVASERFMPHAQTGLLDNTRGGGLPLRIALVPASNISGDVVDALGRTVWNAQVAAGSPPDWERAARTDHAGHFELRGLAPGEHSLYARYGQIEAAQATVARTSAGEQTRGAVLRLTQTVDDDALDSVEATPVEKSERQPRTLGLTRRGGSVVVEQLNAASGLARAGLQVGDVLVAVNGEPVRSAAQARGMLTLVIAGPTQLDVEIRRDGYVQHLRYAR